MADRKVTVKVDLQGGGNLPQVAANAAAQIGKVQQAAKGAGAATAAGFGGWTSAVPARQAPPGASATAGGFGGFGGFLHAAPRIPSRMQPRPAPPSAIPIAQYAPPTARLWTVQDTLGQRAGQRALDAEQQLAFLRSGPGARATIAATRAEAELAKQQTYLTNVAQLGRAGAMLEAAQPALQRAGLLGAAGLATAYGGIASVSPEASSQITNSFRMIANEIGIATIPTAVRFTGVLQSLSRGIRNVNESTNGWAGSVAFAGSLLLTGAGALGMAGNAIRTTATGLRSLGLLAEFAAPVAGQVASRVAAQAGGQALARGGAATAAGATATGAGVARLLPAAGAVLANPATWIVLAGAIAAGGAFYATHQAERLRTEAGRETAASRALAGIGEGVGGFGGMGFLLPRSAREQFASFRTQATEEVLGMFGQGSGPGGTANTNMGRLAGQPAGQTAFSTVMGMLGGTFMGFGGMGRLFSGKPAADEGLQDVSERRPMLYRSAEEMHDAMMMNIQSMPAPLAEQESRAMTELLTALNANTTALQQNTGVGNQLSTWGPVAGENG